MEVSGGGLVGFGGTIVDHPLNQSRANLDQIPYFRYRTIQHFPFVKVDRSGLVENEHNLRPLGGLVGLGVSGGTNV